MPVIPCPEACGLLVRQPGPGETVNCYCGATVQGPASRLTPPPGPVPRYPPFAAHERALYRRQLARDVVLRLLAHDDLDLDKVSEDPARLAAFAVAIADAVVEKLAG